MKRIEYKTISEGYSLSDGELNKLGINGYVLTHFAIANKLDAGFPYQEYNYVFQREAET